MEATYKFDYLLTKKDFFNIQESLIYNKNNISIRKDFKIKTKNITLPITIRLSREKGQDIFKVDVINSLFNKQLCSKKFIITDVFSFFDVMYLNFDYRGLNILIMLNLDFEKSNNKLWDIKTNLFKLDYFEDCIKNLRYTAIEYKISYFSFNKIIEILYVAYMLCSFKRTLSNSEVITLNNMFLGKLRKVGIQFEDILSEMGKNKNEVINRLKNFESVKDVNELCYLLLVITITPNMYDKDIFYSILCINNDMYRDVFKRVIRNNKDIDLM